MEVPMTLIADVLGLTDRREMLSKNVPKCPECDEERQIQLVDWSVIPARWRCRECRSPFGYEPRVTTYSNPNNTE